MRRTARDSNIETTPRGTCQPAGRPVVSRAARVALALLLTASVSPAWGQRSPAEKLIEQERIRSEVQSAFRLFFQRAETGDEKSDNYNRAVEQLEAIGPDAVPLLIEELELNKPSNFSFIAVALGRFDTPEAEQALRSAVVQAEAEEGDFAANRKGWACYGLASMGRVDAVDLLNEGNHLAARRPLHGEMSMLEGVALFTAPASVPLLHAQLLRYDESDDAEVARERGWVLKALRRIGDPASPPKILPLLHDPDSAIRRIAADSLHVFNTPEVVAGLMEQLATEKLAHVRFSSAWSLEQILPSDRLSEFVERLKVEEDTHVRGVIYRIVAKLSGDDSISLLSPFLGNVIPLDRANLIAALAGNAHPAALAVFRAALADSDIKVMIHAIDGLHSLRSERAQRILLEQIPSSQWLTARESIRALTEIEDRRAAPLVARRLVEQELKGVIRDPFIREHAYFLGDALVEFGYVDVRDELRPAAERQRDGHLVAYLDNLQRQLGILDECGEKLDCWKGQLQSEDSSTRILAIHRIRRLGGSAAATALSETFGRVGVDEGTEILLALGKIDDPVSRSLVVRVLTSPTFDTTALASLRETAAWAARELGGAQMIETLRQSAVRRNGEDVHTLVYLAVSDPTGSVETLEQLRIPRLRILKWTLSDEMEMLDKIVREIRAGRSIATFDRAPEDLEFNRTAWVKLR